MRTRAPPQQGCFKLNTNRSWMNLGNAGGGGVIRCDKGIWQEGFALNFNAITSTSGELIAIREGLLMAWKRNITHLDLICGCSDQNAEKPK
uniref:RNase H type-1 domain-containing protein n=1 Tax=Chenopodium quinoa TaxID=63459 RepID=A0A803NDT3_CHEQI